MKTNAKPMIMWAAQHQRVIDTLARDGVYFVKYSYIKEKYQETAWIFEAAYQFLRSQAEPSLARPSSEAESMIWMYRDRKWLEASGDIKLLELQIPAESMVLFDRRDWEKIIGLRYIGTDSETEAFQTELERIGVRNCADLLRTSFYPMQKRKLLQSWQKINNCDGIDEKFLQGGAWYLKKEWILNWDEIIRK